VPDGGFVFLFVDLPYVKELYAISGAVRPVATRPSVQGGRQVDSEPMSRQLDRGSMTRQSTGDPRGSRVAKPQACGGSPCAMGEHGFAYCYRDPRGREHRPARPLADEIRHLVFIAGDASPGSQLRSVSSQLRFQRLRFAIAPGISFRILASVVLPSDTPILSAAASIISAALNGWAISISCRSNSVPMIVKRVVRSFG